MSDSHRTCRSIVGSANPGNVLFAGRCLSVLVVLSGLLLSCGGPSEPTIPPDRIVEPRQPRPVFHGVAVPVPRYVPIEFGQPAVSVTDRIRVPLVMDIDANGYVTAVAPLDPGDSIYISLWDSVMSASVFAPGLVDSVPSSMRLPVIVSYTRNARYPGFRFPVNQWQETPDRLLYEQALALNDVLVPGPVSFPAYFYKPSDGDSKHRVRYVSADVSIDTMGKPTAVDLRHSTSPQVTGQVLAAMNWAEYRPLTVRGKPLASAFHMTVFLYPSISYPTPIWYADDRDTLDLPLRMHLQPAFDTIGLFHQPIPVNVHNGQVVLSRLEDRFTGSVTVGLVIDTAGQATVVPSGNLSSTVQRAAASAVEQIDFLPALGFDGTPRIFRGTVDLGFSTSKIIRIRCHWLFPPEFLAVP